MKGGIAMAAIVYQVNKKTGITYAYESKSYWDKDKKDYLASKTKEQASQVILQRQIDSSLQ